MSVAQRFGYCSSRVGLGGVLNYFDSELEKAEGRIAQLSAMTVAEIRSRLIAEIRSGGSTYSELLNIVLFRLQCGISVEYAFNFAVSTMAMLTALSFEE